MQGDSAEDGVHVDGHPADARRGQEGQLGLRGDPGVRHGRPGRRGERRAQYQGEHAVFYPKCCGMIFSLCFLLPFFRNDLNLKT